MAVALRNSLLLDELTETDAIGSTSGSTENLASTTRPISARSWRWVVRRLLREINVIHTKAIYKLNN